VLKLEPTLAVALSKIFKLDKYLEKAVFNQFKVSKC